MSWVRFNHVFAALLILSALSAFVIPERYTTKAQPQLQGLFYPVAKPARAIGEASEHIVVMHHGLAVATDLQIAFDGVVGRNCCGKGRRRILDHSVTRVMQAAVRHRASDQPVEA